MAVNKNFVVKHGLEVNTDLILANANTRSVGIGTSIPRYTLDVRGGVGATDIYASGISTVLNEFNVGTGGTVLTALNSGLIGVGTASPAYLLDIRSPVSTGQTALYVYGDVKVTGDLNVDDITFDDATVQNLEVTDTLIVGTSGGSGIATIGTLGVIGLTTTQNFQVTGVSTFAGITTVTGETLFTKQLNVSGVSTFNGNVSFGSSAFFSGDSQTKIILGSNKNLEIYATASQYAYINNLGTGKLAIQSPDEIEFRTPTGFYARFTESSGALLYDNNNQIRLQTIGTGVTVTGTLFTNQLSVSEPSTFVRSVTFNDGIQVTSGITTLGITTATNLTSQNLYVSGISTLNGVKITSGIITSSNPGVTTVVYYGDGRFLTLPDTAQPGIAVRTEDGPVGSGITILDFYGSGVSTSSYSVGIATVYFESAPSYWIQTAAGIHTLSSVGIGTTDPASKLHVVGNALISGIASVGSAITMYGSTGIVSATSFYGDGSNLTGIGVTRSLTIGTRTIAYEINVVGTGITLSLRSGIATLTF